MIFFANGTEGFFATRRVGLGDEAIRIKRKLATTIVVRVGVRGRVFRSLWSAGMRNYIPGDDLWIVGAFIATALGGSGTSKQDGTSNPYGYHGRAQDRMNPELVWLLWFYPAHLDAARTHMEFLK